MMPGSLVPEGVAAIIQQQHPHWLRGDLVCRTCRNDGKAGRAQAILEAKMGSLSPLEQQVVESIRRELPLVANENSQLERTLSWPEKLADRVAAVV